MNIRSEYVFSRGYRGKVKGVVLDWSGITSAASRWFGRTSTDLTVTRTVSAASSCSPTSTYRAVLGGHFACGLVRHGPCVALNPLSALVLDRQRTRSVAQSHVHTRNLVPALQGEREAA